MPGQYYLDLQNHVIGLEGRPAFRGWHLRMTFVPEEQVTDDLLEAIRVTRESTGAGLEEAKRAAEEIQRWLGR